jgi:rod shape-determining protein MreD
MNTSFLRVLVFGLIALIVQIVFLTHLTVFKAQADIVFVFGIWFALQSDRTKTLLLMGLLSVLQDALSDSWGIHLISKTLFFYFFHGALNRLKDAALSLPQTFLLILGASAVFQFILLAIAKFSEQSPASFFFWQLLIAGSLYTAVTGIIAHLLRGR